MSSNEKKYQITEDTDITPIGDEMTKHELNELMDLGVVKGRNFEDYRVGELRVDIQKLREIAFEYSILEEIANNVEIEVMRYIRNTSNDRFMTGEIADVLDRPPSTVSRTLTKLVDKGQIKKVQDGVYER